ncbi:hypothetical protein NA57DRAFT_56510 [Rhizodiscina lignyota]|uniref:Uncharacterized protein n=1 Tax=Rhizodiscina lignyota TaxID=1504668 RepID=A0A9P4IFV0_9PEZI|nr:hypothetical protein NA57DRAFT_56510 [Rhizodiscina lignyota]
MGGDHGGGLAAPRVPGGLAQPLHSLPDAWAVTAAGRRLAPRGTLCWPERRSCAERPWSWQSDRRTSARLGVARPAAGVALPLQRGRAQQEWWTVAQLAGRRIFHVVKTEVKRRRSSCVLMPCSCPRRLCLRQCCAPRAPELAHTQIDSARGTGNCSLIYRNCCVPGGRVLHFERAAREWSGLRLALRPLANANGSPSRIPARPCSHAALQPEHQANLPRSPPLHTFNLTHHHPPTRSSTTSRPESCAANPKQREATAVPSSNSPAVFAVC